MTRAARLALAVALALPVSAYDSPFGDVAAVSDAELGEMRGGFALPNGVDVALTVQVDTAVNGALILRTVLMAGNGPAALAVYAPVPGQTGPAVTLARPAVGSGAVTVMIDRTTGNSMIGAGSRNAASGISINNAGTAIGTPPAGLSALPLSVGGPGVLTSAGIVTLVPARGGVQVALDGANLDVTQLVGQALGAVVVNTGNDRIIDSATTINVELLGAGPLIAQSASLRAQNVALDAAARIAF